MLAPSPTQTLVATRLPASIVGAVVVGAKFVALGILAIAGTAFLGLTIASSIAMPIVERTAGSVSASDIATAATLAPFWWAFAAAAIASFAGSLAMIVSLLQHLGTDPERSPI